MKKTPTRSAEELARDWQAIQASVAKTLARATSTRARWEAFRDELEAKDRMVRMLLEAAARERTYLAMLDPADRKLAVRAILYPKPKHS